MTQRQSSCPQGTQITTGRAVDKQKRILQTARFDDQCFEGNKQWAEGVA